MYNARFILWPPSPPSNIFYLNHTLSLSDSFHTGKRLVCTSQQRYRLRVNKGTENNLLVDGTKPLLGLMFAYDNEITNGNHFGNVRGIHYEICFDISHFQLQTYRVHILRREQNGQQFPDVFRDIALNDVFVFNSNFSNMCSQVSHSQYDSNQKGVISNQNAKKTLC